MGGAADGILGDPERLLIRIDERVNQIRTEQLAMGSKLTDVWGLLENTSRQVEGHGVQIGALENQVGEHLKRAPTEGFFVPRWVLYGCGLLLLLALGGAFTLNLDRAAQVVSAAGIIHPPP